jgi:phosphopantetheine--protein transferase-like protein
MERIANLPGTADSWSEPFYVDNFTPAEIAYCLRQADPRQSLCGLWSAKEAAVKCGGKFTGLSLKQIEIVHDEAGRPSLLVLGCPTDCLVSISHSAGLAVAVCMMPSRTDRKAEAAG